MTATTIKIKAVMILIPESVRGTQWHRRPRQTDWLPTPPLSAECPPATPHRRKRRRISEDEEEEVCPAKNHVSFAQEVSAAGQCR